MFIIFLSSSSTKKQSGPLISSRLMPEKDGSKCLTQLTTSSGFGASIHKSMASTPANFYRRTALPSITGFAASGPILPRPKTAVPFVITAIIFPFVVYL